jgi:iron complex transport system permease protein
MKRAWLPLLLLLSLAVLAVAPLVGGRSLPLEAILERDPGDPAATIFWDIRLPRVVLAWLAGAGLSLAGLTFQALFRNSLATPFTLGVSSGASLGAALAVRLGLGLSLLGVTGVTLGAMTGSLLSIGIVYGLTRLRRDFTTGSLLLAGVAVNFFFSSLILLVQYTADVHDTFRILRWLMGGLQMVGFDASLRLLPFVLAGGILTGWLVNELNLLSVGEETAAGRGVAVRRTRTILFVSLSLLVGVVVSVCGPVGFVGLMVPHIGRLLLGPDHRRLVPAVILLGGAFLVICDTLARTLLAPTELPVGIVTSMLGGPFFLWLLIARGAGRRASL